MSAASVYHAGKSLTISPSIIARPLHHVPPEELRHLSPLVETFRELLFGRIWG